MLLGGCLCDLHRTSCRYGCGNLREEVKLPTFGDNAVHVSVSIHDGEDDGVTEGCRLTVFAYRYSWTRGNQLPLRVPRRLACFSGQGHQAPRHHREWAISLLSAKPNWYLAKGRPQQLTSALLSETCRQTKFPSPYDTSVAFFLFAAVTRYLSMCSFRSASGMMRFECAAQALCRARNAVFTTAGSDT